MVRLTSTPLVGKKVVVVGGAQTAGGTGRGGGAEE